MVGKQLPAGFFLAYKSIVILSAQLNALDSLLFFLWQYPV